MMQYLYRVSKNETSQRESTILLCRRDKEIHRREGRTSTSQGHCCFLSRLLMEYRPPHHHYSMQNAKWRVSNYHVLLLWIGTASGSS